VFNFVFEHIKEPSHIHLAVSIAKIAYYDDDLTNYLNFWKTRGDTEEVREFIGEMLKLDDRLEDADQLDNYFELLKSKNEEVRKVVLTMDRARAKIDRFDFVFNFWTESKADIAQEDSKNDKVKPLGELDAFKDYNKPAIYDYLDLLCICVAIK